MKMAASQRISYVPLDDMTPEMREEMDRCAREGTPRPESTAVRAHVPAAFWFFANAWKDLFREGIVDHPIKELCRVYVSHSVKCEYCGNQRSEKGRQAGLYEGKYDDLLNFESSESYTEREKAALAYAEAITWTGEADDALWERLYEHFSEAELVELGCMIGLTLGQQSWLRLLNIDHHQVMPGTSAAMAPGFEDANALAESKSSERYWAKAKA
jgi:alkylhydroperoxidase family enzyme